MSTPLFRLRACAAAFALLALTCCSCKHLSRDPQLAAPPADPTAAPLLSESADAPAPSASAAYYNEPAGGHAQSPVQRLQHQQPGPAAPAPVVAAPAPIVPAQAQAARHAPARLSMAPNHSAHSAHSVYQPGQVVMENGQCLTCNPPASVADEWAPAGASSCSPSGAGCGGVPYRSPDEYLCDGGDVKAEVKVLKNFDVRNIDMTDTVGHFDTLDGRRMVEKSNRVCIYAPRFAAVRRIDRPFAQEALKTASQYNRDLRLNSQEHHALVGSMLQPVVPNKQASTLAANAVLEREGGQDLHRFYAPLGAANPVPPFENFALIQRGISLNSEKPRLNEHVVAALTWMTYDSVEVMINQRSAQAVEQKARPQETVVYELDGKPRLRICKVASTDNAKPGDTVDFTIRFDNVGDQKIGNVTVLDSLTTRLEYVPDSATCTLDADFFTVNNEGDSVVLRWEVKDPLEVGEGGIVRFQCKVR